MNVSKPSDRLICWTVGPKKYIFEKISVDRLNDCKSITAKNSKAATDSANNSKAATDSAKNSKAATDLNHIDLSLEIDDASMFIFLFILFYFIINHISSYIIEMQKLLLVWTFIRSTIQIGKTTLQLMTSIFF